MKTLALLSAVLVLACGADEPQKLIDGMAEFIEGQPAKLVLIFVDASGSVGSEDWALYRRAYDAVLQQLEPGDHAILGVISDRTLTGFQPLADVELPNEGVLIRDRRGRCTALAKLEDAWSRIKTGAKHTQIFDALRISQERMRAVGKGSKVWIVILSDMIEDSEIARFGRTKLDDAYTTKMIDSDRRSKTLPSLEGAQFFVAGATAKTSTKMAEIERFWRAYLAAAGAEVGQGAYGRDVPGFPKLFERKPPCPKPGG